jgi:hypothetical protein
MAAGRRCEFLMDADQYALLRALARRSAWNQPLTRPATADENAVVGHPLPQGGEGSLLDAELTARLPPADLPICRLPTAHCLPAHCPSAHCLNAQARWGRHGVGFSS